MPDRIVSDVNEYLQIIKGQLRPDLLIGEGRLIVPKPGESPTVFVDLIRIPRLREIDPPPDADLPEDDDGEGDGSPADRGIGKIPGKPGTILGPVDGDGKDGKEGKGKGAGRGRGGGGVRIELSQEEFDALLAAEFELPRIQPKGNKQILAERLKYKQVRHEGPQSLLHRKRTMREAMKRSIASGDNVIIPIKRDKRYRGAEVIRRPENNAVIFYMMDVSGSVDEKMRRIIRYYCGLCSYWLSRHYTSVVEEWIIHDGEADRVDREEFFGSQRSGGTTSSSAHLLAVDVIDSEYPPQQWNIYVVYLSDGFNFSDDNEVCRDVLAEKIIGIVNQYVYVEIGDVDRPGMGQGWGVFAPPHTFKGMVEKNFGNLENVSTAVLSRIEDVREALKATFRKGG